MLEALLNDGWAYHATESARFACELETAADSGVEFRLLAEFLKVSTHTIGEHLADRPRARRLGERVLAERTPDTATARTFLRLARAHALRLAGDTEASDRDLAISDAAGAAWENPGPRSWYAEERARTLGRQVSLATPLRPAHGGGMDLSPGARRQMRARKGAPRCPKPSSSPICRSSTRTTTCGTAPAAARRRRRP